MARRRYYRGELQFVFGRCIECGDASGLVARVPHSREKGRKCQKCLTRHRRLLADREVAR